MKRTHPTLAMTMILALMFSIYVFPVTTSAFSDSGDTWAAEYIQEGVDKGFVGGYPDGTFHQERPVTRAEFVRMANLALGLTFQGSITYPDVNSDDWFAGDVKTATGCGYIRGNKDGTFAPDRLITRQEAALILARIIPGAADSTALSYTDAASIATWATSAVAEVSEKAFMTGYPDGHFRPTGALKRGEAVKILCEVLDNEKIISTPATLQSPGDALSPAIYTGDVTIEKSVGDGLVTIQNCTFLCSLYVFVGGAHPLNMIDTLAAHIILEREEGAVRLVLIGNCDVGYVQALNDAVIDTLLDTGKAIKVVVKEDSSISLQLSGVIRSVTLQAPAKVELTEGIIQDLIIGTGASGSNLKIDRDATITVANLQGVANFEGEGSINSITGDTEGSTFSGALTLPQATYQAITPYILTL